jgi:hypothetical protein
MEHDDTRPPPPLRTVETAEDADKVRFNWLLWYEDSPQRQAEREAIWQKRIEEREDIERSKALAKEQRWLARQRAEFDKDPEGFMKRLDERLSKRLGIKLPLTD